MCILLEGGIDPTKSIWPNYKLTVYPQNRKVLQHTIRAKLQTRKFHKELNN